MVLFSKSVNMDESVKRVLNRRASLLRSDNKTVPAHHETISNLGVILGQTVLNEMSPIAKDMMGIDTPFPTAPKTLWISPTDRMDNDIFLKPPPNEDVIKALTHEGILEIGTILEKRLEENFQSRIKAMKKEVEEFERFECNNRIKFAIEQEKIAHDAALKQQREDLLKMFQKDREDLLEESKIELETVKQNLASEHKLSKEREVRLSMEQLEHSTNDKINEYTDHITLLQKDLENTKNMVNGAVEKRKKQDWQILHEMFVEMHRQFTTKLTCLQNQHNAEIRHLYLENKTKTLENEHSTTCNDDSLWEDESLGSEYEQENIEFHEDDKPFVISVCKVEGESSEEDQSPKFDRHSTGSSFKCYKHRSQPKKSGDFGEEPTDSKIFYMEQLCSNIPDANDINTTDISCNVLRRLGLNFNSANIEKVKIELDDMLVKMNKRETKLLTATDSLDLITEPAGATTDTENLQGTPDFKEEKKRSEYPGTEEYKRIVNRRKSQKVIDSKLAIPLTVDEYVTSLTPIPKYMQTERASISIWDYKVMTEEEWNVLLQELDNKLRAESAESSSKNKTVTVTTPNSIVSLVASDKIPSSNTTKPTRGILRSSLENKIDSELLLKNDVFQTNEMQCLVNKLAQ